MQLFKLFLIYGTLALLALNNAHAGDWSTCSSVGFCGVNPSLPLFGPGPLTNLDSDHDARVNAMHHIAWAVGIPLLGQALWGNKGRLYAGLSWIAFSLIQEALFHSPKNPGGSYPSEVRTDLITRIVPTIIVISF